MTDPRTETPIGPIDASGQPLDVERIIPPEQPPMDDAAGPQTEDVATDDLSVQGGE